MKEKVESSGPDRLDVFYIEILEVGFVEARRSVGELEELKSFR